MSPLTKGGKHLRDDLRKKHGRKKGDKIFFSLERERKERK